MIQAVGFFNPATVHAPQGSYSHSALVQAGTRLLFVAGQIGMRPDGSVGPTLAEQADQAFANLVAVLKSHDIAVESIVKLSTYLVAGQSAPEVALARRRHLGEHKPAATFIFVPQLYHAEWLIEVEAVASAP